MVSAEEMGVEKVVAVKVAVVKAEVVMDLEAKAEEVRAVGDGGGGGRPQDLTRDVDHVNGAT